MVDTKQLRGLSRSLQGVAMDMDDPDDAATCTLAVDWMQAAANEIERLRKFDPRDAQGQLKPAQPFTQPCRATSTAKEAE